MPRAQIPPLWSYDDVEVADAAAALQLLRTSLYCHSAAKLARRLRKTVDGVGRLDPNICQGEPMVRTLRLLRTAVNQLKTMNGDGNEKFLRTMLLANTRYRQAAEETGSPLDPKLTRYLDKAFYVETNAQILLRFAFSRRLRPFLDGDMQPTIVSASSPSRHELTLPTTTEAWKECVETALRAVAAHSLAPHIAKHLYQKAVNYASRHPTVTPKPHCEAALAVHLWQQQNESTRAHPASSPLGHVGVSKLCCLPCSLLLEAVAPELHLVTKGFHGKTYFPWLFPEELGDAVRARFLQKIMAHFVLTSTPRGHTFSDSSTGTFPELPLPKDFAAMEEEEDALFAEE